MSNTPAPDIRKPLSTGRKIAFSGIILLFFLILIVVAGELILRDYCMEDYIKIVYGPPYDTAQKDDRLGWKMTPGYTFEGKMRDEAGQEYDLSLRYDENGFKAFGDTASEKPKVLFLGDSYTASIEVSNEKSFFNLLGDSLGIEVFAYGHAGFGTLQEYLVLDEWVDKIRPDVIVWEVCSNDFIDNYAPLEIVCGYKVGERRPYLSENGEIFYRRPLSIWQRLKEQLIFFRWLEERWDGLRENLTSDEKMAGEYYISIEKRAYPLYNTSIEITEKMMANVKNRIPEGTQVIGFAADIYQPQVDDFRRIFKMNGFLFSEKPGREIETADVEQKRNVKAADSYHWNEQGHAVVAQSLLPLLKPLIEAK